MSKATGNAATAKKVLKLCLGTSEQHRITVEGAAPDLVAVLIKRFFQEDLKIEVDHEDEA